MNSTQLLARWLDDAHAMELQLIPVLQNHADDMRHNPMAEQRLRRHIDETRQHAARLEQCLRLLGTSPSGAKSNMASLMGSVQAVSTGMFADELVRNAVMDYAAEQMEVASYRALVTAAQESGQHEIARLCGENLLEDEAMAAWLNEHLPMVVRQTLQTAGAGL